MNGDIRDILRGKGIAQAPQTDNERQWGAEVRPEPESPDELPVPSGKTHNRMVQTLFVYPPGEDFGYLFQYCDMTSPGQIAVDGSCLILNFRGVGGMWRVAIEGERLAYLAGCVGAHKQGVIQVTKPDEWRDGKKLVKESAVANIVVTQMGEDGEEVAGPRWAKD